MTTSTEFGLLYSAFASSMADWVDGPSGFLDPKVSNRQIFSRRLEPLSPTPFVSHHGFQEEQLVSISGRARLSFDNVTGSGGWWRWTSVAVSVDNLDPASWSGLDALVLPSERATGFPLSLVTPLDHASVLPSVFSTYNGSFASTHMVMRQNAVLELPASSDSSLAAFPVGVLSDALISGDPLNATSRVLDLAGLSWSSNVNPSGFVAVGGSTPNANLYIRNLVLFNLQAISPCPGPGDLSYAANLSHFLCNFTSLMWFFDVDRSVVLPS